MRRNWERKTLSEVCDKASSNVSQNQLINEAGDYPIYGASGFIKNVSFYHQDKEYVSIIKDGAGIGRIALLPPFSSVIGTLQYLIPKENINIRYFYYFLNGINFLKHKNGSTIPHIYFKDYATELILVPPLPEQKRIVAILDEAFAAICKAKENAEKNLQNARELFESYLQSVFANPGDGWEEKTLNEICDVRDGTHESPKYIKEGIPFITQKNIRTEGLSFENTKFITEEDHNKFYKRSNVTFGDILISMIGANRGMACIVDDKRVFSIKNVGLIKVSEKISNHYLLYYLKSSFAMQYVKYMSNGGAQEFVGLTSLRSFPIPYCKLSEQKRIVAKLNALSAETKKLEAIYKQKLTDLDELKKSILQKAFEVEL